MRTNCMARQGSRLANSAESGDWEVLFIDPATVGMEMVTYRQGDARRRTTTIASNCKFRTIQGTALEDTPEEIDIDWADGCR